MDPSLISNLKLGTSPTRNPPNPPRQTTSPLAKLLSQKKSTDGDNSPKSPTKINHQSAKHDKDWHNGGWLQAPLVVVVIGGDLNLAIQSTIPSLFKLFHHNCLPVNLNVICFGETSYSSNKEYRELLTPYLTNGFPIAQTGIFDNSNFTVDSFLDSVSYITTDSYDHLPSYVLMKDEINKHIQDQNRVASFVGNIIHEGNVRIWSRFALCFLGFVA